VHFSWKACYTDTLFVMFHTPSVLYIHSTYESDCTEVIYFLEYHAVSILLGLQALNMKALPSFETSVTMYQSTRRKIQKNWISRLSNLEKHQPVVSILICYKYVKVAGVRNSFFIYGCLCTIIEHVSSQMCGISCCLYFVTRVSLL
jgi:hypothetical protein